MTPPVQITEGIAEGGYAAHLSIANACVEVVVATEFGPRIVAFRTLGGPNVFATLPHSPSASANVWRSYGGHRLWAAPEDATRTYAPDNDPVRWRRAEDGVIVTGNREKETGFVKEITVALDRNSPRVRVTHRITNLGPATELAPWALTVMRPGGSAIIPNAPFIPHPTGLLPARVLVLWPYTELGDARFSFGRRLLRLRQDRSYVAPQKIGAYNERGWAAYAVERSLFVKHFPHAPAAYPDMGSNFETFTDDAMLELESLGPLVQLGTDETVEHVEYWALHSNVVLPANDEEAARTLEPLVTNAPLPR